MSADELNRIAASLNSSTFLGYPNNYPDYTTGSLVGGAGQQALSAFIPLSGGGESRGVAGVAQSPFNFPPALQGGYFVGFHGLWDEVGTANTVNPIYFVNPVTGEYSAFVTAGQSGFSKPDGLLASAEGLYIADMFTVRQFGASSGALYLVARDTSSGSPVPEPSSLAMLVAGLTCLRLSRPRS